MDLLIGRGESVRKIVFICLILLLIIKFVGLPEIPYLSEWIYIIEDFWDAWFGSLLSLYITLTIFGPSFRKRRNRVRQVVGGDLFLENYR